MNPKAYMAWMFASAIMIAAACAVIAIFADPYRLFGTTAFESKPAVYNQAMLAKTVQLERVRPNTLLLGNSRIEIGMDPESVQWPADWRPVFNAGVAGQGLFTSYRLLQHAVAIGSPKRIIVGVDIQDFLSRPEPRPGPGPGELRLAVTRDGAPNPERTWQRMRDALTATLTMDALGDSLKTIFGQDDETGVTMTVAGFNPLHDYIRHVRTVGHHGLFAQKLVAYTKQYAGKPKMNLADLEASDTVRILRSILDLAAAHGIEVTLLIYPYHADYLAVIRNAGLWESVEAWKQALVAVVSDSPLIERLIDFSVDSGYIGERVPAKGDTTTHMRWYWEPGHFKAALGELMIARIVGRASVENFGVDLTERLSGHLMPAK